MKEGWEYKKIKDIGSVIGGTTPNTNVAEYWDGTLCWISPAELDGSHYLYDSRKKITEAAVKAKSLKILPVGTVILSSRAPIGKVVINKVPTYCNQGFKCVICGKEVYNEFLYWWLWGKTEFLNSLGTGATFKEISKKVVEEITIPVPPLSEQQSIVEYLDSAFAKIDAMKANAEKALNEAKALFQASLKEMLEPKEGWEERKLQEVASDFSRGKSKHRPRNDKKLFGGKYPFIQTGEIRNSNVYVTSHSSTYNELGLSQSKLWPEDTVCITIAANIAEVAILKYPSCFPDSVIGFVADKNRVDKMFVFYSLLNYQQELKKQGKGSAQDNINLGTFEKNKFPFPSLQEQQTIVEYLDSLKSKVDKLQENYDKISQECDALKQAILRQVFE